MDREPKIIVIDGYLPDGLIETVRRDFPLPSPNQFDNDSASWVHYDNPVEKKWARNKGLPPSVMTALGHIAAECGGEQGPLGIDSGAADLTLYGGGCHVMGEGDHLDLHLDADRHPAFGLERAMNAILFIGDWRPGEWGGAFELWDFVSEPKRSTHVIWPKDNRLILFETNDRAVHGVPVPIPCPPGVWRKSLALYWWKNPRGEGKRPRALFLPNPWDPKPELNDFRKQRSQING